MNESMDQHAALELINEMKIAAEALDLGLIIAGSVGYRSALLHHEAFDLCDDLDCIFVYIDIRQLQKLPYLRRELFATANRLLEQRAVDMVSTKLERNGIRISADFVSREYLKGIADDYPKGFSSFRTKLTDAIEKEYNTYCSIAGDSVVYHKPCEEHELYRIYRLPINWYHNHTYYPGVLLNKYLYNPTVLRALPQQDDILQVIRKNVYQYCAGLDSDVETPYRVYQTCYRRKDFSAETKAFLMSVSG